MITYLIVIIVVLHAYIVWHLAGRLGTSFISRCSWFVVGLIPPLFYVFLIKLAFFSGHAVQNKESESKPMLEPFSNL